MVAKKHLIAEVMPGSPVNDANSAYIRQFSADEIPADSNL
jgi:hypothetical protein